MVANSRPRMQRSTPTVGFSHPVAYEAFWEAWCKSAKVIARVGWAEYMEDFSCIKESKRLFAKYHFCSLEEKKRDCQPNCDISR